MEKKKKRQHARSTSKTLRKLTNLMHQKNIDSGDEKRKKKIVFKIFFGGIFFVVKVKQAPH